MRKGPESLILRGEPFVIKQFETPQVPILAHVSGVNGTEEGRQIVCLTPLYVQNGQTTDFHMTTERRLDLGVYTDRHNNRLFLRANILGANVLDFFRQERLMLEELLKHFQPGRLSRHSNLGNSNTGKQSIIVTIVDHLRTR